MIRMIAQLGVVVLLLLLVPLVLGLVPEEEQAKISR
jgi:hypothetical protein